jgi:hypothetical protein
MMRRALGVDLGALGATRRTRASAGALLDQAGALLAGAADDAVWRGAGAADDAVWRGAPPGDVSAAAGQRAAAAATVDRAGDTHAHEHGTQDSTVVCGD